MQLSIKCYGDNDTFFTFQSKDNSDVNTSFAFQSMNVMVNGGVITKIVSSIGWGVAKVHIMVVVSTDIILTAVICAHLINSRLFQTYKMVNTVNLTEVICRTSLMISTFV